MAGCFSPQDNLVPTERALAPLGAGEAKEDVWRLVATADALRELGRDDEAQQLIAGLLAENPLFVPAARLHQNYHRERGRTGLLWQEVELLKARYPGRPEPLYLEARLIPEFREKKRFISDALARFPGSFWVRYAAAWCLSQETDAEKRRQAEVMLRELTELDVPWAPALWLLYHAQDAHMLPSPHLKKFTAMARRLPEDGRLDLLTYIGGGGEVSHLLAAVEKAPASAELLHVLANQRIADGHGRTLVRFLARRPEVASRWIRHGAGLLLARLALQHGEQELAEDWLRKACSGRTPSPAIEWRGRLRTGLRESMRLAVHRGDIDSAIEQWESRLRPELFDAGRNRIGARVQGLLRGPLRRPEGPKDAAQAVESLRILLRAGWVEEAAVLAGRWTKAFPNDERLEAQLDEAEDFLLFEEAFADLFGGPTNHQRAKGSLQSVIGRVRELSQRVLGRDVVGQPRILTFPLLGGELLDPFGPGLTRWFDHYNRHLVLGSLSGKQAAVILGVKLFEARLPRQAAMPLLGLCREVVIESKLVSTSAEIGISDPAGIALWNHYVLDLRAMRKWVADLLVMRDRLAEQQLATVLDDPIAPTGALDMSRPCQVSWKLTGRAMLEGGWDEQRTWREVYRLLQIHERAHLRDAHRFLPVGSHIGPALWLFAAAGFSTRSLLANLEGRAECAALALGADPTLALGHLTGFMSEPYTSGSSVHQVGFKRVLRRILELWQADGAPGALLPDRNLFAQLHRVPRHLAVHYARAVLEELGF